MIVLSNFSRRKSKRQKHLRHNKPIKIVITIKMNEFGIMRPREGKTISIFSMAQFNVYLYLIFKQKSERKNQHKHRQNDKFFNIVQLYTLVKTTPMHSEACVM